MTEAELISRLGVALLAGLGAGIERGHRQRAVAEGQRAAGVRTFVFIALAGACGGLAVPVLGPWFVAALGLCVGALLLASYLGGAVGQRDLGLTTEVAALVIFAAGVLSGLGQLLAAALVSVATIVLLHNKSELHGFVAKIEHREIDAALKVLTAAVVLLPLAPDRGFGPGGVLNPYALTWALVVISAVGLAGHAAMRALGPGQGAAAMGLIGGLVSSTAVAVCASSIAGGNSALAPRMAAAVALAHMTMFLRTAALTAALHTGLALTMALPLLAGAMAAGLGAWLAMRVQTAQDAGASLSSSAPDTMNGAMQFVCLTAAALFAAGYAEQQWGAWGFYASGFLTGLADADASTVIAAQSAQVLAQGAGLTMILGLTANSVAKAVIARRLGGAVMGAVSGWILLSSAMAVVLTFLAALF